MATRSAKLYQGEDMLPVLDYTDYVIWEESEFGTRAWQGEGSASTVVIRDPLGEQGNELLLPAGLTAKSLASKNLFVIDLDGEYMFRGRVGIKNYSRDDQRTERYRQVECSLHDTNWDLDHIFVNDYPRPAETDNARISGIIASYLSGSPRATTHLNGSNFLSGSNTVNLAEQTYNRTSPLSMIREISRTANKQFFVTGDSIGGGSLFWDGNDSTVYQAGIRISDRISEVNTVGGGASAIAHPTIPTPNGDWETGDSTNWTAFPVVAGDPSGSGGSWWGFVNTLSPGVRYDGWVGDTFTAGVTYTVRFFGYAPNHPMIVRFGDPAAADFTDTVVSVPHSGAFATVQWTPSANRTAASLHFQLGLTWAAVESGQLGMDVVLLLDPGGAFTFPPIWNVGPASTEDGSEQLCEVVLYYGTNSDQYVTAHNLTVHNQYGHSSQTFTDDAEISAATALLRARAILAHRQYEDKTYNVTIGPLTDAQVMMVKHGQTIQIKARAIPDADDQFRTMRIVQCRYTTPVPGTWFAHMQLGRPWKLEPYGSGPTLVPTTAGELTIADVGDLIDATDVEGALQELAAASGVTDHGALTGLPDDDHSQYLNAARHTATDHTTVTEAAGRWEPVTNGVDTFVWDGDEIVVEFVET